MKREILFKAQRTDGKGWVEGLPKQTIQELSEEGIIHSIGGFEHVFDVDPETVCQYTGLKDGTKWDQLPTGEKATFLRQWNEKENRNNIPDDWNGRKIFEGDLIKGRSSSIFSLNEEIIHEVIYASSARFHASGTTFENLQEYIEYCDIKCEVKGNIHDKDSN